MIIKIRRHRKIINITFLFILFFNSFFNIGFSMPGGPSQPESSGFSPVEYTEMVNKFNGKFSYNIPLMDVGGYPINLVYDANVNNDSEASWVGLGWSLNTGSINRIKRGLPDDFKGDLIQREVNHKPINRWGASFGPHVQLANMLNFSLNGGVYYSNRTGWGTEASFGKGISLGIPIGGGFTAGLGLNENTTSSSEGGVTTSRVTTLSLGHKHGSTSSMTNLIGLSFGEAQNSRQGLMSRSWGLSLPKPIYSGVKHTHSYIDPSYLPTISIPYKIKNYTGELKGGFDGFTFDIGGNMTGYKSSQEIAIKNLNNPSFGYMNSERAFNNGKALMDFNREKDIPYHPNVPNIAIPNYTYDLFTLNQHKGGGQFRIYRQDIGLLKDPDGWTEQESFKLGLEGHGGKYFEVGVSLEDVSTSSKSGSGYESNLKSLNCINKLENKEVYEPYYFAMTNEVNPVDIDFKNQIVHFNAVRFKLNHDGTRTSLIEGDEGTANTSMSPAFLKNYKINTDASNRDVRTNPRATYISSLDHEQRSRFGFDKTIQSYSGVMNTSNISYNETKHHISEFSILNNEGERFIYGIPVYNLVQEDYTFSSPQTTKDNYGLCSYATQEATKDNNIGREGFFNKEITPKYPHTWLLSAYLSPDYIDVTNNGITDDDLGNAVKLNYTKSSQAFSWRNPMAENGAQKATLNLGVEYLDDDNKGVFSYGEREEWYNHSIESKTHIAFFELEDRLDCKSINRNGSKGSASKSRLKAIYLYSKAEVTALIRNNSSLSFSSLKQQATPIKVVQFVYDYSLCANTPNSDAPNKGKLTLKAINIMSGKNATPVTYSFDYGSTAADNPPYSPKNIDRWGNRRLENKPFDNSELDNDIFPYTNQNKSKADLNSKAWLLKTIMLPSGGSISVDYESHDYSYIQDKRTAKMYKVIGTGSGPNDAFGNNSLYESTQGRNIIFFETDLTNNNLNKKDINKMFFEDPNDYSTTKYLYFKMRVKLNPLVNKFETIPGYAEIDDYGVCTNKNNGKTVVWVKVKPLDGSYNPITSTAWQFIRDNVFELAWEGSTLGHNPRFLDVLGSIKSNFGKVFNGEPSFHKQAINRSLAKTIELNGNSVVRAYIPSYTKYGGGNRVKKITMSDKWDELLGSYNGITPERNDYEIEYDYTKPGPNNTSISSGVASYEPLVGGDENPWRKPKLFKGQIGPGGPTSIYNIEEPFGETLFPSADIGYSKVTTTTNKTKGQFFNTGNGFKTHEFYTAYDYPVKTSQTNIESKRLRPPTFSIFFYTSSSDDMSVSQGYGIILNDMHGKLKKESIYKHGTIGTDAPISYTQYFYKTNLNVPTINQNGGFSNIEIGAQTDFFVDIRSQSTDVSIKNYSPGGGAFPAGPFLIPIPWVNPLSFGFGSDHRGMKTIATNKITSLSYQLERVETMTDGAITSARHLAWDPNTASTLLSASNNNFNKDIYTLNIPAYYSFPNMGHASKNEGVDFNINIGATHSGRISILNTNGDVNNSTGYLKNGDEVAIACSITEPYEFYHYIEGINKTVFNSNGNPTTIQINAFVNKAGNIFIPSCNTASSIPARIIKSTFKNLLTAPLVKMETREDNFRIGNYLKTGVSNVLNASAYEYTDIWKGIVNTNLGLPATNITLNPYKRGLLGNWRNKKVWHLYGNRTGHTGFDESTNIANEGTVSNNPSNNVVNLFYVPSGSNRFIKNPNAREWFSHSENSLYDAKGNSVEDLIKITFFK